MNIACLDFEGVLVPEIWISVAEKTGIPELRLTTRDIADYDVLMKKRLEVLAQNNLTLKDIQKVIEHHQGVTNYGELKKEIAEQVHDFLTDFQANLQNVDDAAIMAKLEASEQAMNAVANETLHKVQQAVGLRA